jgi:hypothetical protein
VLDIYSSCKSERQVHMRAKLRLGPEDHPTGCCMSRTCELTAW